MGFLYSQLFVHPPYPARSFDGETVLVTGANIGLSLEAARHIVRLGAAKVILGVRKVAAGEAAKEEIEKSTGRPGTCEVWEVDLASHSSTLNFGDRISQLPRLDAAIMNAALATPTFQLAEGYERTITVNVINTLLLGLLILSRLQATGLGKTAATPAGSQPRLSFVISEVHGWIAFPEWETTATPMRYLSDSTETKMGEIYAVTKLFEVLLVQELAGRVRGTDVIVNMLNPGLCHSSLARDFSGWRLRAMKLVLARSTEVGSRTLVAGISTGLEGHGAYMTDSIPSNNSLSPFVRSSQGRQARDVLWKELSMILEQVRPGIMQSVSTL